MPGRTRPGRPGPARTRQGSTRPGDPASTPARAVRHPVLGHLVILVGFLAAGIGVSWPRATYLTGSLPDTRDAGSYVWGFWWVAHQIEHFGNPWFTRSIAAPVGTQLGLHALVVLPSVLLIPVTAVFGPSASYNLLSLALPGLMCYAMYRVARLWLPSQVGAIAAGAFFGLSSMLTWRSWYHMNLAAGALFLPIVLEAAVRFTRRPDRRQAVILGVAVGAALLTDQELAVLAIILAACPLLPWLLRRPVTAQLKPAALALAVGAVVASPQIIAIVQQFASGGAGSPTGALATSYVVSGVQLPDMFLLSPRVGNYGLGGLGFAYSGPTGDGIATYGLVLSLLAVFGVVVGWRQRRTRRLALLWLGCILLSLGAVLKIGSHEFIPVPMSLYGRPVSAIMPYSWFVRIPGMSGFREANRIMMLGIVPASLLAGAAVNWLRYHAAPAIAVVAVLAFFEAGWSGNPNPMGTMPTSLPAVDGPIAADHSGSLVVDIPFGIRGGTNIVGSGFDPEAQVLQTADGHPRAVGFISRVPQPTVTGVEAQPFYWNLLNVQAGRPLTAAELAAAQRNARAMGVGWVIDWNWGDGQSAALRRYLHATGFRFDYKADGAYVYRPTWRGRVAVPHAS